MADLLRAGPSNQICAASGKPREARQASSGVSRTLLFSEPDNWTVTIGIASIKGEYIVAWNEIMAASAIVAVPVIIVFLWLEKYLVVGLTAGAQK